MSKETPGATSPEVTQQPQAPQAAPVMLTQVQKNIIIEILNQTSFKPGQSRVVFEVEQIIEKVTK